MRDGRMKESRKGGQMDRRTGRMTKGGRNG